MKLFTALLTAAICCPASAQLTQPVAFGEAVVVEQSSPGLVPSMKFNYINAYGSDLSFRRTLAAAPLLQSPGAITFSAVGDIYLAEPCAAPCVQRIMRYEQSGGMTPYGEPLSDYIRSMTFLANGDLAAAFSVSGSPDSPRAYFARLDTNGRMIKTVDLPDFIIFGFDVDRDGCTVVFTGLRTLAVANLCSADMPVKPLPQTPNVGFSGVRFLPSGNLLVSSPGAVYELSRNGVVLRRFVTSDDGLGEIVIDPDGMSFWASCGNRLFRFDLTTGNVIAGPVWLHNAVYGARSMAVRGEWRAALHPKPRRRSVRR